MKKVLLIVLVLGLVTGCSFGKDNNQSDVNNNEQNKIQVGSVVGGSAFSINININNKDVTLNFDLIAKVELNEMDEPYYYYGIDAIMKNFDNSITYDSIEGLSRASFDTDSDSIFNRSYKEEIITQIIKDKKTNEEYAVIYITSGDKVHNIYILNEDGDLLYKYNKGEYFAVQKVSNNEKYPLIVITDKNIKVIEETNCDDFHYEIISFKNGNLVNERVEFDEAFYLSGGC